ncbi:MAG: hypothetical protein ABIH77_03930 [Pseudomonadota bacterium]|nr:hypothetical protein [Gammaproteobacteria bacterium]MBU1558552.1 hypothetical protein [Gammaproteobacteria bacterium]MBU1926398.1 hypothetical protein [Gammaproteobacteria bacterium]MBU2545939.1 hypothetical protein [Gammaproteobacteria bacterium]
MKKILVFLFLSVISSVAFAQQNPMNPDIASSAIDLSFVQTAKAAFISPIANKPGYYKLILDGVSPYTVYYAGRPSRISGIAPTSQFVSAWSVGDNSFKDNNPNAILTAAVIQGTLNKSNEIKAIELSDPQYNIAQEQLNYVIKPLPNETFVFQEMNMQYVTLTIN